MALFAALALSLSLLKKEKLIPHHSEGWEVQDQGGWLISVAGEKPLPGFQTSILLLCPQMAEKDPPPHVSMIPSFLAPDPREANPCQRLMSSSSSQKHYQNRDKLC